MIKKRDWIQNLKTIKIKKCLQKSQSFELKRMIKIEVCVSLFVCMNGCANLSKKIFTTKSL